jgi:hypothetical protein
MSKITIDKNFQTEKDTKTKKMVFTPIIRKSSLTKNIMISHSSRSTKLLTKK